MIFSANDVTRTRLCAIRDCEGDAMIGHAICDRCARLQRLGKKLVLHVLEQPPAPDTQLPCCGCKEWKVDAEFPHARDRAHDYRRNRNSECKDCAAKRRRVYRLANPPSRCAGLARCDRKGTPLAEPRPCNAWARRGSEFCSEHGTLNRSDGNAQVEV